MKKIKNNQPQTKFTGSFNKKSVRISRKTLLSELNALTKFM